MVNIGPLFPIWPAWTEAQSLRQSPLAQRWERREVHTSGISINMCSFMAGKNMVRRDEWCNNCQKETHNFESSFQPPLNRWTFPKNAEEHGFFRKDRGFHQPIKLHLGGLTAVHHPTLVMALSQQHPGDLILLIRENLLNFGWHIHRQCWTLPW